MPLPTLRSRRDEVLTLASLYPGNLNMELGKQVSGFKPRMPDIPMRYG